MNVDALSGTSKRIMSCAKEEAKRRKEGWLGVHTLIIGLLLEGTSATYKVLLSHDLTAEKVRKIANAVYGRGGEEELTGRETFPCSSKLEEIMTRAEESANSLDHHHVCPSDLFFAAMKDAEENRSYQPQFLDALGLEFEPLRQEILVALEEKNAAK